MNVYDYLDILPHAFKVSHSAEIVNEYTEHTTDWPYKWHFQTSIKNGFILLGTKKVIFTLDNQMWNLKNESSNKGLFVYTYVLIFNLVIYAVYS